MDAVEEKILELWCIPRQKSDYLPGCVYKDEVTQHLTTLWALWLQDLARRLEMATSLNSCKGKCFEFWCIPGQKSRNLLGCV